MKAARNFAIIALVALAFTVAPGGGPAINVAITILTIGFFATIAFFGYRLYREHRLTLDSLEDRQRLVLYASVGLAFLTFVGTSRLWNIGGGGIVAWLARLALASYVVFWVFTQSRRYD